ncbi:MAG: tRNA 2-selenouridine(34) synthase MnmH [Paracoccaceae bacterium]
MGYAVHSLDDLLSHPFDSVIDVRSPAEFALDHLPGAINLPVLNDAERVRVGTIYVQDNAFSAKKIGAALVARNAARHLDGPLANKDGSWQPLVYCWRGGQRSGSFATILSQVGWRVQVLEGGYKTYRRLVSRAMYDAPLAHRLIILDGNTGTAKTELLQLLRDRGQQVIDLEGLAAHRGSVFGAVERPQPSQKSFEAALAVAFAGFDTARPVLLEAESSKIGKLIIPPSVWKAMNAASRLTISASIDDRATYLTRTYHDIVQDRAALRDRLDILIPHQGRERVEAWQTLADQGQMKTLATELMQSHYDPSYARSRARRQECVIATIEAKSLSSAGLAQIGDRLLTLIAKHHSAK